VRPLSRPRSRPAAASLGYVVQHGEELVANKAAQFSHEVADAARAGVPQDPPYDEDRMLTRLIREALFHRDSERRHLAALLISSFPFGSAVTDELLARLGENIYPEWMRARLAILIRYLSNDTHRLRVLPFADDKSDDVGTSISQGLGHQSYSPTSDQALRDALA
jgi:hypothetical protein